MALTEEEKLEKALHRQLFDAANNRCALWKTPDGELYADVLIGGTIKSVPIVGESKSLFVAWLRTLFSDLYGGAVCRRGIIDEVVSEFYGRALMSRVTIQPALRVAGTDNEIYWDLGTDDGKCIMITGDGWGVKERSPYKFMRPAGVLPIKRPVQGAPKLPILLRSFISVHSEEDMSLLISWLVMCMRPTGPYPILVFSGEHGTTKTSALKVLKRIIDPMSSELKEPPREQRDMVAAIRNQYVVCFDNISSIPNWFADSMCRVSTGASLGGRALYTNHDEATFTACRPQALNGIPNFVERGDFVDRCISITLASPKEYLEDSVFWTRFEKALPQIQGALLDAVSGAITRLPNVVLSYKPRMINFAQWAQAAEPSFDLLEGTFLRAYKKNRMSANENLLEFSPLAQSIYNMLQKDPYFYGTYQHLLSNLTVQYGLSLNSIKSPYILATELRRIAPSLRMAGIDYRLNGRVSNGRDKGKTQVELRNTLVDFEGKEVGRDICADGRQPSGGDVGGVHPQEQPELLATIEAKGGEGLPGPVVEGQEVSGD